MKYSDPWEHKVIDDFYEENLFQSMRDEIVDFVKTKAKISSGINVFNDALNLGLSKTNECINSKLINEDYLHDFSEHRYFSNLKIEHQIIVCVGESSEYRIHDERPEKILSAVLYIAPGKSTGTLLYDKNKNFVKEVDWKPNRVLMFPGITGKTWHNYKTGLSKIRITLNTFLVKE